MLVGKILSNRYQISQQIRKSQWVNTYLAQDNYLPEDLLLVVQQIKPKTLEARVWQRAQEIFNQEAKNLYFLGKNHPQIPKIKGRFIIDGEFYLLQEYIMGEALCDALIAGKPWQEERVKQLVQEILLVLQFVHANQMVHGNLRPETLVRRYTDGKIVLLDFAGIERVATLAAPHTQIAAIQTDIAAVGKIAISALSGSGVEDLQIHTEINNLEVSSSFRAILQRMTAVSGGDCYPCVANILQDLISPPGIKPQPNLFAIKPRYTNLFWFSHGLAPVEIGSQWGYIDQEGDVVILPQFDAAFRFGEGLAPVKQGRFYGYINLQGTFVIPPQFEDAYWFNDGIARVQKDNCWGYINKEGQFIIPAQFDDAYWFNEGIAPVRKGKKYVYIDKQGNLIMPEKFDTLGWFHEGLLAVETRTLFDCKWGYIDKEGNSIIPAQFDKAYRFSQGLAPVKHENQYGYIDKMGNWIIKPQFEDAYWFTDGIARVQKGNLWGYIDKEGSFLISPKFNKAYWFTEGLARVRKGNKWGYINSGDEIVIEPQFDNSAPFFDGMAAVKVGDFWGFIANPLI